MECEKEEADLPQFVKDAGPPPHFDKENAWKQSWRALEDVLSGAVNMGENIATVESIGVSNFDATLVSELVQVARTPPQIIQANVWSYVFDPHLMKVLDANRIHFQAYNVMNGVFSRSSRSPNALRSLEFIARELSMSSTPSATPNPTQVVLKWLVDNSVSIIPRTTNQEHLKSNSQLQPFSRLTAEQGGRVKTAVQALLQGRDISPPVARFHNKHHEMVAIYWRSEETGEEHPVKLDMEAGSSVQQTTFPGHTFVAYNKDRTRQVKLQVPQVFGETVDLHVEL